MDVPGLVAHADSLDPDMVVISASSFDVHVADRFTADLKRKAKPPVVVGIGQGYYSRGKDGNSHNGHDDYDVILLGEPEEVFFRLFDSIREDRRENGESWKEHFGKRYIEGHKYLVTNPDSLPFPCYTEKELETYRSIFPIRIPKRVVWGYIIGMRGCPHNCVFCSEVMRVSVGKKIRKRSASNVADEFEHMASQGVNIVSFQDDSFSANRGFVRGICEELIKRKSTMPWMARVRIDEVDYDILKLMKQAGCVNLGIGVESGTQRIIDDMKKTRRKEPWPELCRQVFRWTRKLGIGTNAYYVIGNPTETREEIEQTIRLAKQLNSDSIQVHYYTPYPGSEAWERYKDQITDAETTEMFHYATPQFSPSEVPIEDLVKLRSRFYRRYILRPSFGLLHMWNYWRFYVHNPGILKILIGIRKVF
jgi:radical SAM superfamily enzyme YgiQ (UPF0313 family)